MRLSPHVERLFEDISPMLLYCEQQKKNKLIRNVDIWLSTFRDMTEYFLYSIIVKEAAYCCIGLYTF